MAIIGWFIAIIIIVAVLFLIYKSRTQIVPQEKRLVIYRLGRFNRIVGPGPVTVLPGIEEVVKTIEVRDHPIDITVPGIIAFGVPNTLTLNMWCRFDPVKAAGGNREKLAQLAQISTVEHHTQIKVKAKEALIQQVSELQAEMPLPPGAGVMDGVIALAPGRERYKALLAGVARKIEKTLPLVGVILDMSQPIVLTGRGLPNEIIEALQMKRGVAISGDVLRQYAASVRTEFPHISDAVLSQILGSIPGVDLGSLQRISTEQGASVDVGVETEMHSDGSRQVNIMAQPKQTPQRPPEQAQVEAASSQTPYRLTKSDLAVLKRVPHN